jgi:hypothetical protein
MGFKQHRPLAHHADVVKDTVIEVYGESLMATVAQSAAMSGHTDKSIIENEMRSPAALTVALLEMIPETALITQKLRTKIGAQRPGTCHTGAGVLAPEFRPVAVDASR